MGTRAVAEVAKEVEVRAVAEPTAAHTVAAARVVMTEGAAITAKEVVTKGVEEAARVAPTVVAAMLVATMALAVGMAAVKAAVGAEVGMVAAMER